MEQGVLLVCLLLQTVFQDSICWGVELTGNFGLAPCVLLGSPALEGAGSEPGTTKSSSPPDAIALAGANANQGFKVVRLL